MGILYGIYPIIFESNRNFSSHPSYKSEIEIIKNKEFQSSLRVVMEGRKMVSTSSIRPKEDPQLMNAVFVNDQQESTYRMPAANPVTEGVENEENPGEGNGQEKTLFDIQTLSKENQIKILKIEIDRDQIYLRNNEEAQYFSEQYLKKIETIKRNQEIIEELEKE